MPRNDNDQADALARIGSTRQAIPSGVALRRLLKPSIKPSPESDSIYVPAPPEEDGSDSKKHTVEACSGTSELGPGTAPVGPGAAPVGPEIPSIQQTAADSNPPPPSPATLVQVAVLAVEEIAAPSWA